MRYFPFPACCGAAASVLALVVIFAPAFAQETKEKPNRKGPEPRQVSFTTKDGLELWAWYFPSDKGREAVPVLLLHDWGGSGSDFKGLAEHLQSAGHAVLVPDLRGHGDSTKYKDTTKKELDLKRMQPRDCRLMYSMDVEACKNHLIKENNLERLNIEKLCIVGVGLGGLVGMNWAIADWSVPDLLGGIKQGRYVKALVLISTPWTEKTVSVNDPLKQTAIVNKLAFFIITGKKGSVAADAGKIHKRLEAARGGTGAEKELVYLPIETNNQGIELLAHAKFRMLENIEKFVAAAAKARPGEWARVKDPLAAD
jgi:pimeloyl-ACP methyl ester carboxylesterase